MTLKARCGVIITTVARKLQKSIEQRGLGGTLRRCVTRPLMGSFFFLKKWAPSQIQRRRGESQFDRRFNVSTRQQRSLGWMADIRGENWRHGTGYDPVPIDSFANVLRNLPIAHEDFVFIDFGSGKGRSLFLAAEYSFRQILGVEYSPQLHEVAMHNIQRHTNEMQKCTNIQSICHDAAVVPIPPHPLVLFFHHPFEEPVFRPLVQRLEQSLAANPRTCFIVYYDPRCATLFDKSPHFQRTELSGTLDSTDTGEVLVWLSVESVPVDPQTDSSLRSM